MSQIRIVIASHGKMASGMLDTVQMLLGEQTNIVAYCLEPTEDVANFTEKLKAEVEKYGSDQLLFLTELVHGSPFNCVVSLTRDYDIYHVSGVNMAMLLEAALARNEEGITVQQICERIVSSAQTSILDVRKVLSNTDDGGDEG